MKYLLSLTLILCTSFSFSQEGLEFTVNKQFYLKGNSALIGNNIVSTDAQESYNDSSGFNDALKLEYIDIDDNSNTFSSSSANLNIESDASNIKYAALYWSAIYKYDKGVKRTINQEKIVYKGNDERSSDINKIQFKTPKGTYQPITGEIVYDSFTLNEFQNNSPYLCYADVTAILKNSSSINGTYTLANMRATEGYISGGASGGWLLYIVYESESEKPKYFTTYNGFVEVNKNPVDITFKDFKTNEEGEIKTSICLAALEGDQKLKTDMCSILDAKKQNYIPLYNSVRPLKNFFNGTISMYDEIYIDRTPNSSNTLGFDLMKLNIPNTKNTIISNNSSEATIQLKNKADRFYLFFVAFETEISPIYLEGKSNKETLLVLEDTEDELEEEPETPKATKPIKTETPKEKMVVEVPKVKPKKLTPEERQQRAISKIEKIKSIKIPNLEKGYYLVTNVFSVEKNATQWKAYLKEKGHQPASYINPKNGWHYIYLKNDLDPKAIYLKQKELSKLSDFKDIWILKINF